MRTTSDQRLPIIDSLRGWALLGVVLMNYFDFYTPVKGSPKFIMYVYEIFFAAKSWTLLSFLFGFGFAVLMDRGYDKGPIFLRRMFWLLVLAVINTAFYPGDILKDYAVLGAILFLFRRCSARTSLWIGLGLLIALPWIAGAVDHIPDGPPRPEKFRAMYYSHRIWDVWYRNLVVTWYGQIRATIYSITVHVVMMACFFLGMAAHKSGFFLNIKQKRRTLLWIFVGGIATSATIWLLSSFRPGTLDWLDKSMYVDIYFHDGVAGAAWIASLFCLFYTSNRFYRALQYMGRMTLTNYMTQNVLIFFLFSGAGFSLLKAGLPLLFFTGVSLGIYILQIFFSRWWLSRYRYGPVEWVWRSLTLGKRLPLRK